MQALLAPEDLVAGNALLSLGSSVAGMAGPALGGVIMGMGGAGTAFAVDGLSFLAAAAALLTARAAEPPRVTGGAPLRVRTLVADLVEALRLLAGRRFLVVSIAAMAIIVVTGQAPVVLLRPWMAERAGGGAWTLSVAYSCFAAGLAQMGMARVSAPWQLWVLDFTLGAAVMVYGILWPAVLQESVPPEAMGRVAAIDQFGTSVLYPAGVAAVGGLSAMPGGAYWVVLGGGLLTVLVALFGLRQAAAD